MKTVQLSRLERDTKGLKFFSLFTLLGWGLIMFAGVVVLGLIVSSTGAAYWGGNAKVARDAAATGSFLVSQLTTLALWKHIVLPLLILGLASFYGWNSHGVRFHSQFTGRANKSPEAGPTSHEQQVILPSRELISDS